MLWEKFPRKNANRKMMNQNFRFLEYCPKGSLIRPDIIIDQFDKYFQISLQPKTNLHFQNGLLFVSLYKKIRSFYSGIGALEDAIQSTTSNSEFFHSCLLILLFELRNRSSEKYEEAFRYGEMRSWWNICNIGILAKSFSNQIVEMMENSSHNFSIQKREIMIACMIPLMDDETLKNLLSQFRQCPSAHATHLFNKLEENNPIVRSEIFQTIVHDLTNINQQWE